MSIAYNLFIHYLLCAWCMYSTTILDSVFLKFFFFIGKYELALETPRNRENSTHEVYK